MKWSELEQTIKHMSEQQRNCPVTVVLLDGKMVGAYCRMEVCKDFNWRLFIDPPPMEAKP